MKRTIFLCALFFLMSTLIAQEVGQRLPKWREGQMEIHHINTGRGVCTFCIFPDGTTMLIDAGDLGPRKDYRQTQAKPYNTKQEALEDYIEYLEKNQKDESRASRQARKRMRKI